MILGYDWKIKKRENLRTGLLLFRSVGISILNKLPLLLRFNSTVGSLCEGEYYISNVAVYPQYRGMGIGKRLLLEAEYEARRFKVGRMVLDVEKENIRAINFYRRLGYEIIGEYIIPLKGSKTLRFYRMSKDISKN